MTRCALTSDDITTVLILATEEARPGMKLAAPVQHPDHPDQVLLRSGYVLEKESSRKCSICASRRSSSTTRRWMSWTSTSPLISARRGRRSIRKSSRASPASQRSTQAKVDFRDYCNTTKELIETLLMQGKNPLFLDQMSRMGEDAVGHATTVAHLALLLGIKLENYLIEQRKKLPCNRAKDIVSLGVAGMLHDIGKTALPPHVDVQVGNESTRI